MDKDFDKTYVERCQKHFNYLVSQRHIQEGELNGSKKEQESTEVKESKS